MQRCSYDPKESFGGEKLGAPNFMYQNWVPWDIFEILLHTLEGPLIPGFFPWNDPFESCEHPCMVISFTFFYNFILTRRKGHFAAFPLAPAPWIQKVPIMWWSCDHVEPIGTIGKAVNAPQAWKQRHQWQIIIRFDHFGWRVYHKILFQVQMPLMKLELTHWPSRPRYK